MERSEKMREKKGGAYNASNFIKNENENEDEDAKKFVHTNKPDQPHQKYTSSSLIILARKDALEKGQLIFFIFFSN